MTLRNRRIFYLLAVIGIAVIVYYQQNGHPALTGAGGDTRQASHQGSTGIDELTSARVVIPYVKEHHKLPAYYITKQQARAHGWIASEGNLCSVLPGKAIGGDVFSNREGSLPGAEKRKWFEADLNYHCGHRNADRLLFSTDGLVFVTYDHYKTFQQK